MNKRCRKCRVEKPETDEFFYKHSGCKGGLHTWCKACIANGMKVWREAKGSALKEKKREYRLANIDEIKARGKAYYSANKGKWKEYHLDNYERIRGEMYKRVRVWRSHNKEKVNVWVRNYRAKKRDGGNHSIEDIRALLDLQQTKCVYCEADLNNGYEVDHIVPVSASGKNDRTNLQLLCPPCNRSKGSKDPIMFAQARGFLL